MNKGNEEKVTVAREEKDDFVFLEPQPPAPPRSRSGSGVRGSENMDRSLTALEIQNREREFVFQDRMIDEIMMSLENREDRFFVDKEGAVQVFAEWDRVERRAKEEQEKELIAKSVAKFRQMREMCRNKDVAGNGFAASSAAATSVEGAPPRKYRIPKKPVFDDHKGMAKSNGHNSSEVVGVAGSEAGSSSSGLDFHCRKATESKPAGIRNQQYIPPIIIRRKLNERGYQTVEKKVQLVKMEEESADPQNLSSCRRVDKREKKKPRSCSKLDTAAGLNFEDLDSESLPLLFDEERIVKTSGLQHFMDRQTNPLLNLQTQSDQFKYSNSNRARQPIFSSTRIELVAAYTPEEERKFLAGALSLNADLL